MKILLKLLVASSLFMALLFGCKQNLRQEEKEPKVTLLTCKVNVENVSGGTISVTKDGVAFAELSKVPQDTVLTFTLKANEGYHVVQLTVGDETSSAVNSDGAISVTKKITADVDVTAEVVLLTYKVNVENVSGGSISVTKDGTAFTELSKVPHGAVLTFTLKANEGYHVVQLTVGDETSSAVNSDGTISVIKKITADVNVTAKVAKNILVELIPQVTEPTNKNYNIKIKVTTAREIDMLKWAKGDYAKFWFTKYGNGSMPSGGSNNEFTFEISENGVYSVYVRAGADSVLEQIDIKNFDRLKPNPVQSLKMSYDFMHKTIESSWVPPLDNDIDSYTLIWKYEGLKKGTHTCNSDINSFVIQNIDTEGGWELLIYVYDKAGNMSDVYSLVLKVVNIDLKIEDNSARDIKIRSVTQSGNTFTVTADPSYDKYRWYVDGEEKQNSVNNVFNCELTNFANDEVFEIMVLAQKGSQYRSASIAVKN